MKIQYSLWVVPFLLAGTLAGGEAGKTPADKKTFLGDGFRVAFPSTPKATSQAVPGVTIKMWLVEKKEGAFLVALADLPDMVEKGTKKEMLDKARDGALKNARAELKSEKEILLAGKHPGREIVAGLNVPAGALLRVRIYLVDRRLYQVMVLGRGDFVQDPAAAAFLDSFALVP